MRLNRNKNLGAVKSALHWCDRAGYQPLGLFRATGLMQAYPDEHERAYFEKSWFAQIKVDRIISTKAFPNVNLTLCFPSGFYFWNNFFCCF